MNNQRIRGWGTISLCVIGLATGWPLGAQAEEEGITIEKVVNAWKGREQRVRTFRFEWEQSQTFAKGSLLNPREPKRKNPDSRTLPAKTTTYKGSFALMVDGGKMRYVNEEISVAPNKETVPMKTVSVSDGKVNKKQYLPGPVPYPRGYIGGEQVNPDDIRDPLLAPVLLTYRPFHPVLGSFKPEQFVKTFRVIPGRPKVSGRSCVLLKGSPDGPSATSSLWLDPEREFAIIRYAVSIQRNIVYQLDCSEYERRNGEWISVSWKDVYMDGKGEAANVSTASKIVECDINLPIADEEFQMEFPTGTWVTDRREPASQYIVLDGGKKRPISRKELAIPYEVLLNTEPGQALGGRRISRVLIGMVSGAAICAVLILLWRWKQVRSRRAVSE